MSILTSLSHTVTSRQPLVYRPITAPNGTRLCAVYNPLFGPIPETFDDVQLTRCALSTMMSNSAVFNYNQTDGHCSVFQSPPLSYEPADGCVAYEVWSVCSLHPAAWVRSHHASHLISSQLNWSGAGRVNCPVQLRWDEMSVVNAPWSISLWLITINISAGQTNVFNCYILIAKNWLSLSQ